MSKTFSAKLVGVQPFTNELVSRVRATEAATRAALFDSARVIQAGVAEKMPVDTGITADALEIVATPDGYDVQLDESTIHAHGESDDMAYVGVIEFGSDVLGRAPVAPFRRTIDEVGRAQLEQIMAAAKETIEDD